MSIAWFLSRRLHVKRAIVLVEMRKSAEELRRSDGSELDEFGTQSVALEARYL